MEVQTTQQSKPKENTLTDEQIVVSYFSSEQTTMPYRSSRAEQQLAPSEDDLDRDDSNSEDNSARL